MLPQEEKKESPDIQAKKTITAKNKIYLLIVLAFLLVVAISCFFYLRYYRVYVATYTAENATKLFEEGKQKEAIKILEKMHKENPQDQVISQQLAIDYYKTKDYDKFLKFCEENKLKSDLIYNLYAGVYQSKGDTKNAEKYYKKAIEIYPGGTKSYISLAAFYQAGGELSQALETLQQGLANNANSSVLYISASSVAIKIGNLNLAREYATKALDIDKNNTQAKAILERL